MYYMFIILESWSTLDNNSREMLARLVIVILPTLRLQS